MTDFLPIMIDLHERAVVIFGGGEVGERKAFFFCDHAKVTVVSREFTEGLNRLNEDGKIKLIKVNDISGIDITCYLENAFIAIPATNDMKLNEKISGIAGEKGIFVNRVDDIGDIIIPSVIRRGDIVIGISTLGNSPAVSKYIRQRIEEVITPEMAQMSRLQNEIREMLRSGVEGQKQRKEILWNIINDDEVWEALLESYEKAYMTASKHIR